MIRHYPCLSLRKAITGVSPIMGLRSKSASFLLCHLGREFEVKVKVTGEYKARFDQAGLMLRIDHENYIKAGIEFVDGKFNLSTVVTLKRATGV